MAGTWVPATITLEDGGAIVGEIRRVVDADGKVSFSGWRSGGSGDDVPLDLAPGATLRFEIDP